MNQFTRSFFDRGLAVLLASLMLYAGSAIPVTAQSSATTQLAKLRFDGETTLRGVLPDEGLVAKLLPGILENPTVAGDRPKAPQGGSVTLTPFTVFFGNQPLGYPSDPIPVTLTNNQSVSLSITSIATRSGHGEFSQTNNCGRSLSPHSSCTINVVFTPQVKGQHAGTLTVTDNGPGGSQYSSLGGIGGL